MKSVLFSYQFYIVFIVQLAYSLANENEFCRVSRKMEEYCGYYTYKIVKPLLSHIHQLKEQVDGKKQIICEEKSQEIQELQEKLLKSKDDLIHILQASNDKERMQNVKHKKVDDIIENRSQQTGCIPFKDSPGIHRININGSLLDVLCDSRTASSGWLVIQKRFNGQVNFNRNWNDYKNGFGNLRSEFFIGLDNLHRLTYNNCMQLYIKMVQFDGIVNRVLYDNFTVAGEEENYKLLSLGEFSSGGTTDAMRGQEYCKFSTFDRDNDNFLNTNCAMELQSGWWHSSCQGSNLNGVFYDTGEPYANAMSWEVGSSLKAVTMLVRPCIKHI